MLCTTFYGYNNLLIDNTYNKTICIADVPNDVHEVYVKYLSVEFTYARIVIKYK